MAFNKIAEAFVEIDADKGKFSSVIGGAKRETAGFAKSATKNLKAIGIRLAIIGAAATLATVAIVKLTKAVISVGTAAVKSALKYDKLDRGLIAVMGSAEAARIETERLAKVAEDPGLTFENALRGSINLQAAGIEADLSRRALSTFGNALVTVGKGADDLAGVTLALTQIANKTSGFGQDVRQLQERLPQMQTALKNAFDGKPLEDLNITGKELVAALVVEFEKLETASGGPANEITNLGVAFDRLKAEAGKALLEMTGNTAKGLSEIINKIRMVLPVWKENQDVVGKVFANIIVIGLKATGIVLREMGLLIFKAAPLVWKPLLFAFKKVFMDLDHAAMKLIGSLMVKLGIVTAEEFAAGNKRMEEQNAASTKRMTDEFKESWQKSFDAFVEEAKTRIPTMFAAISEGLQDISSAFDPLLEGTGKATASAGLFSRAWTQAINLLSKGLAAIGKERGFLLSLDDMTKEQKAALKLIGDFNARSEALMIKDNARIRKASEDNADFLMKQMQDVADFRENLAILAGEREAAALEKQKQEIQAFSDTVKPAFENMFQGLFSGNTKGLWEAFWTDLKNIAIRQMAQIFATQLVAGLLTGGTSFGASGLGAALSAIAPQSVDPTSRAIGGAIGRGARSAASFLEGGSINFHNVDLNNMDTQTITRQVEQAIGPALAVAAADGI